MPRSSVVGEIEKMAQKRAELREQIKVQREKKAEKEAVNQANGRFGDVDFAVMIEEKKYKADIIQPHSGSNQMRLCVNVRKRPIFLKEEKDGEIDAISCANPMIQVLECKKKVDGITKYVDSTDFVFDNTFNEKEDSAQVYKYTLASLLPPMFSNGVITCFAYGQTGSGKTFTMVILLP